MSFTFRSQASVSGAGTPAGTYTFTNMAVGPADADRTVLVGFAWRAGTTVVSVTIGGVTATHVATRVGASAGMTVSWYRAAVPTGTTATVVLALSGGSNRAAAVAYSSTAVDLDWPNVVTASDSDASGASPHALQLSVNTTAGAHIVGLAAYASVAITAWAWAGLDEDVEANVDTLQFAPASANAVAAETPRAITATATASDTINEPTALAIVVPVADVTVPELTNPTGTATGETTADLSVDTDEGNGTLYWVVTTSSSAPSGAQIVAGQDHTGSPGADSGNQAVSGSGEQTANATGLTAGTTYWAHFVQDDDALNRSDVATSASFTTDSDAQPVVPIELDSGAGGGRRRGRRYPYPNVLDDGWDWEERLDPKPKDAKLAETPPEAVQAVSPPARPRQPEPQKAAVRLPELVLERPRPASLPSPAVPDDRVAVLEAEVESLRAKVARLEAERRDDEEEQRLLAMLLDDKED